jgi:hypothetical protein
MTNESEDQTIDSREDGESGSFRLLSSLAAIVTGLLILASVALGTWRAHDGPSPRAGQGGADEEPPVTRSVP